MRRLLTKKEVTALIDSFSDLEPYWVKNDNERKLAYGKILAFGNHTALMMMLKALYIQKKDREANKKHLSLSDERFLKATEQLLYDEWQYVLEMDRNALISYISSRTENASK